jgi:hypothetical protein
MIIEKVDPGHECFSDYVLDGTDLIIGGENGVIVDLEAEESDNEVVISFCQCNGTVHRGLMPQTNCAYIAEIIIPPRRYEDMEVENENAAPQDEDEFPLEENGEEQLTHTERIPVPLDIESVKIKVWPVEAQEENENKEEGEENAE